MHATLDLILEQVRGVWRFRWTAMLVAWVVCIIGWLVVLALSDTYSAWARVYIDTHTGFGDESSLGHEVAAVREALLGGPQLEKVARLAIPTYAKSSPAQQRGIVEGLRKRLQIDSNGAGTRDQPPNLYSITYTDPDRDTARRVVDQLLQLFLTNSLGERQKKAAQTQQLLNQEIAEYDKKLQAEEAQLADFSRLQAAKDELEKLRLALQSAEQKRDALKRELSDQAAAPGTATPGESGSTDTEAQIQALQTRLRELLLHYTDNYPEVIDVRRALEDLKAQRQAEIAAEKRGDRGKRKGTAPNPADRELRRQLRQADLDVATFRREVDRQQARIDKLTKMMKTVTQFEAEYSRLKRDHEATLSQRQALVEKLNRAELADKEAATGAVERFEVVEPATVSEAPVSPDRPRLILVVLLGGIAAGLGVAYFLHQLRPVFTSARELGEITRVPVLGIVSMNSIERHMARARRAVWAYAAATAVLVLVTGIVLLIQSPTSQLLHGLMV